MSYHRIVIDKAVLYVTSKEIHRLLLTDRELFREALQRGKAFKRHEDKSNQYQKKFSDHESQTLNDYLQ